MSVVVSSSTFAAAIAAANHINTLRIPRAVLWKYKASSETWIRITHSPSIPLLRAVALPNAAYLISEEYLDIHGTAYDATGNPLGDQPVKGMLREAHPDVKWVNPDLPDPFPWLSVCDIAGGECTATSAIPAGWVSRVITVTPKPEEEEEEEEEQEAEAMSEDDGL
jgi:hypothetical protein